MTAGLLCLSGGANAQESSTSRSAFESLPLGRPAIYGYVTDQGGHAVANATVEVYLQSDFRTDYDVTDAEGFFAIVLPRSSDLWEVRVKADGYFGYSSNVPVSKRERIDVMLRRSLQAAEPAPDETRERHKSRKLMEAGLNLCRSGKRAEGIAKLREAIAVEPEYCAAHNNLAVQLRIGGNLPEAEAELRAAVRIEPLDYYSHFNLGALLYETGRYHEAAPALEGAVFADPTSAEAVALLGRTYLALGRGDLAIQNLNQAQQLYGGRSDLQLEISDAQILRKDLRAALAAKESWLTRHGADPRSEHVRATVAALKDRLAAAPPLATP